MEVLGIDYNCALPIAILLASVAFYLPFTIFERSRIPHPSFSRLHGNLLELVKDDTALTFFASCLKKYGKVFGFFIGRRPFVFVADPNILGLIFVKEFSNFHDRRGAGAKHKSPMNLNLLFIKYKDWKRIRPTINPTFSVSKIKQIIPLLMQSVNKLVNILDKHSQDEETIDIFKLYEKMTMEIILSVAFGLKIEYHLVEEVSEVAGSFFKRRDIIALIIELLPLPRMIKERLLGLMAADPTYIVNLLESAVNERKRKASSKKDFLQFLLSERKEDGQCKLSDEEIYGTAMTFLLAGYETTSNALAFTTYLLALHPDIQERLYNELKDCDINSEGARIYEDIQKYEFLDAVFNESLRIFPPAWRTSRNTEKDIDLGKYMIPADTTVIIPISMIHHSEEFWKDHDKFDPERFSKERKHEIIPYTYMPFGHGPRNCIGMRFALIEAKLTLIALLKKFRFVKTDETESYPLKLSYNVTMCPANGVKIRVIER